MLDKVRPDALIIAAPNALHLPIALDAIARGIPVLVEKPVAASVAEGEAIALAAQEAGVPVLVGHHRRHNPIIAEAKKLIDAGALGRLVTATVLYTFLKPPDYFDLEWRRRPGGGPVLINLVHEIDLIRHLCGEIASVQALTSNASRGFEVEDTGAALLRLVNGALVTLSVSDAAVTPWSWDLASGESALFPPQPERVQTHFLSGADGSLALPTLDLWTYGGAKGWMQPMSRTRHAAPPGDPYAAQLAHFRRVVRREEAPLVSAEEGVRTLRAVLAVHEAARSGARVDL